MGDACILSLIRKIRDAVNEQFLVKYKEKQLDALIKVEFPAVAVRIIAKYL